MARDYSAIDSIFGSSLQNFVEFTSWAQFYPDLFLDLNKPATGGITLHPDQRVFMRCATRFFSMYGCFVRGWGKTYDEILMQFVVSLYYPNLTQSITAQTRENAVKLLKDKTTEILQHYPFFKNEIVKMTFTKNDGEIIFKNGARIDALANSPSSKGQRRKRLSNEESVLQDSFTFDDSIKPIVEVPRYTCGPLAVVNPEERNGQINFFTTPGWRGSTEFNRNLIMLKNMVDCKGDIVLGASWMLGSWYGRGSSKSQILQKKTEMSPTAFDQNYGGRWTGSGDGALVNINKLLACRTLEVPILQAEKQIDEYYMAVDVARSQNTNNNQSSIVVGKVIRDHSTNRILSIDIVFLMNVPNILNFSAQALIVKKVAARYNPKMVIVDGNGLGSGLIDKLLEDNMDPVTHEVYMCWDTVNTTNTPQNRKAVKCLYDIKAQGIQTRILTLFVDMVDSGILRLLQRKNEQDFTEVERKDYASNVMPYVQTDVLIEEISNLKLKHGSGGAMSVEKLVAKIDKDRFSALSYLCYYIMEFTSTLKKRDTTGDNVAKMVRFRPPKRRQPSY